MNCITKIFKKVILGYKASGESYIHHMRKLGVEVGEDVHIYYPNRTNIDLQNPHLLTIGNHVWMTGPVTILTHDFSWAVLKHKYGELCGNQKPVKIGNNVFLGWGSCILCGVNIGDNVIIGAQALVTKDCEPNSVYAGNPARKIMSLDEYYDKRKESQLEEAEAFVKLFYERHRRYPKEQDLREYFYLFSDGKQMDSIYRRQLEVSGNYDESLSRLQEMDRPFDGFDRFIEHVKEKWE